MAGELLRVTEGEQRGKLLTVEPDLLLGRRTGESRNLGGDPEISRRHARIRRGPQQQLTIEDLGSANGTFVNGARIDAPRTLAIGDVIRVGKTVLQVTDSSGAVPERSRPQAATPADEPPSARTPPEEVLVVTAGEGVGRPLTLRGELLIGRGVSGEGRLGDDSKLSRRHARFFRDAGGPLTVEDLGSANGTFVNGQRVHGRRVLVVGDSVRVGSTTLELTDLGHAAGSAAPAERARRPPAPPRIDRTPDRVGQPPPRVAPAPSRDRLAQELSPDSIFAGCRVEEVIGHGEMGVVYRAEELALQRPVALKLILPEYSREQRFRERFRRESRIAASIDHPNVVPIFDAGDEDGVLYIMMRLVEGTDLGTVIAAEGGVEPLRAARIVRQVGAALDAAHARGMLHRDVKASNVLLGRGDHPYLSDFGLAKRALSEKALTRHGTVVARAEYVAPEQVLGQRVDARADTYALGCVLFETLTGEPPFARWSEGPQALAHVEAPPPSILEVRPDLPREFDDVVRQAMAKDPNDRYPSAGDLGEAALVAAGGVRRAPAWSVVATGEAAPWPEPQIPADRTAAPQAPVPDGAAQAGHADVFRWAVALAGLVIVAVGMVTALQGISGL